MRNVIEIGKKYIDAYYAGDRNAAARARDGGGGAGRFNIGGNSLAAFTEPLHMGA